MNKRLSGFLSTGLVAVLIFTCFMSFVKESFFSAYALNTNLYKINDQVINTSTKNDLNHQFAVPDGNGYKNMTALNEMETGSYMYVSIITYYNTKSSTSTSKRMFLTKVGTGTTTPKATPMASARFQSQPNDFEVTESGNTRTTNWNDTTINIWTTADYFWKLTKTGDNTFTITSPRKDCTTQKLCATSSSKVEFNTASVSDKHRWVFEKQTGYGDSVYRIQNKNTNTYLNSNATSTTDTAVGLSSDASNKGNMWIVLPVLQNYDKDAKYGFSGYPSYTAVSDRKDGNTLEYKKFNSTIMSLGNKYSNLTYGIYYENGNLKSTVDYKSEWDLSHLEQYKDSSGKYNIGYGSFGDLITNNADRGSKVYDVYDQKTWNMTLSGAQYVYGNLMDGAANTGDLTVEKGKQLAYLQLMQVWGYNDYSSNGRFFAWEFSNKWKENGTDTEYALQVIKGDSGYLKDCKSIAFDSKTETTISRLERSFTIYYSMNEDGGYYISPLCRPNDNNYYAFYVADIEETGETHVCATAFSFSSTQRFWISPSYIDIYEDKYNSETRIKFSGNFQATLKCVVVDSTYNDNQTPNFDIIYNIRSGEVLGTKTNTVFYNSFYYYGEDEVNQYAGYTLISNDSYLRTNANGTGMFLYDERGNYIAHVANELHDTCTLYYSPKLFTITLDNQGATSAGDSSIILKYNTAFYNSFDNVKNAFVATTGSSGKKNGYKENTSITKNKLKNLPTKTGYSFGGYYTRTNGSGTKVFDASGNAVHWTFATANTKLYALWTPVSYSISYNLAGGTVSANNKENYNIETASFTLTNPTRTGYTFTGWTGTGLNSATTTVTISKGSMGNKEYTATWRANQYTVKFDGNGSTSGSMNGQPFTYGTAQKLTSEAFDKQYTLTYSMGGGEAIDSYTFVYTFSGWSKTKGGAVAYANNESVSNLSTEDGATVNLYAVWTCTAYTLPTSASKTGYTFLGWGETSSTSTYIIELTLTDNKTVYAQWRANTYTVTYHINGGFSGTTAKSTHTYDAEKALTSNGFSKEYTVTFNSVGGSNGGSQTYKYTFAGWAESPTGNVKYGNGVSVKNLVATKDGNKDLYAVWSGSHTLPSSSKNYTITLDAGNGTCSKTSVSGSYKFGGWSDGTNVYSSGKKLSDFTTSSISLTAQWSADSISLPTTSNATFTRKFTVTFNSNKGSNVTGKEYAYSFSHWSYNGTTYSTLDFTKINTLNGKTVSAVWTNPNGDLPPSTRKFTVSYDGNKGTTPSSQEFSYTHNGWKYSTDTKNYTTVSDLAVKNFTNGEEVSLIASWTNPNGDLPPSTRTFTVNYDGNGGTVSSESQTVSYTYKGWTVSGDSTNYTTIEALADKNFSNGDTVQLTASWTNPTTVSLTPSRSYKITLNVNGGTIPSGSSNVLSGSYDFKNWTATGGYNGTVNKNSKLADLNVGNEAVVSMKANWTNPTVSFPTPSRTFSVTIIPNGATNSVATSLSQEYTFNGWGTSNYKGSVTAAFGTNEEYDASWTAPTISFPSAERVYDLAFVPNAEDTGEFSKKYSYTLVGWTCDGTTYTPTSTVPTSKEGKEFTASWNAPGKINFNEISRPGYEFVGWSENPDPSNAYPTFVSDAQNVTANKKYYAYYLKVNVDALKNSDLSSGTTYAPKGEFYGLNKLFEVVPTCEWTRLGSTSEKIGNSTTYTPQTKDKGHAIKCVAKVSVNGKDIAASAISALYYGDTLVDAKTYGDTTKKEYFVDYSKNISGGTSCVFEEIDKPISQIILPSGTYSYELYGIWDGNEVLVVSGSTQTKTLKETEGVSLEGEVFASYKLKVVSGTINGTVSLRALPRVYKLTLENPTVTIGSQKHDCVVGFVQDGVYKEGGRTTYGGHSYYYSVDNLRIEVPVLNNYKLAAGSYIEIGGVKVLPVSTNSANQKVVFDYINQYECLKNNKMGDLAKIPFGADEKNIKFNISTTHNSFKENVGDINNVNIAPLGASIKNDTKMRFTTVWYLDDKLTENRWFRGTAWKNDADKGFGTYIIRFDKLITSTTNNDFYDYLNENNRLSEFSSASDNGKLSILKDFIDTWNKAENTKKMSFGSNVALDVPSANYYLIKDDEKAFIEFSAVLDVMNATANGSKKIIYFPYASYAANHEKGFFAPKQGATSESVYIYAEPQKIYTFNAIKDGLS